MEVRQDTRTDRVRAVGLGLALLAALLLGVITGYELRVIAPSSPAVVSDQQTIRGHATPQPAVSGQGAESAPAVQAGDPAAPTHGLVP